jgi:hypothetical protein
MLVCQHRSILKLETVGLDYSYERASRSCVVFEMKRTFFVKFYTLYIAPLFRELSSVFWNPAIVPKYTNLKISK